MHKFNNTFKDPLSGDGTSNVVEEIGDEQAKGDDTYRREYLCEFGEMEGAVFSRESIAAFQDFEPLSL